MQAYLKALFRSETGVDDALAERLAVRVGAAINRMLVWDATPPPPAATSTTSAPQTTPPPPAAPSFDPFAFSVIVVLAKKGEAGLIARLEEVPDADQLKAIAYEQHIGLKGKPKTADELRKAIVVGAKQRIADRRAAAS